MYSIFEEKKTFDGCILSIRYVYISEICVKFCGLSCMTRLGSLKKNFLTFIRYLSASLFSVLSHKNE
jgi:hypothetical protein